MNDAKTVLALRNRSEAVIGEVIDKYSRLLWSVAGAVLNNIGSIQDIEDCVSDAFIYLWEHPEKYDSARGKLKTWLCIIVRSYAYDRCRKIVKQNIVSLEDPAFVEQLSIVDGALREDDRHLLVAAVNALHEPDREILIRRYYYNQKPKDIALALNMNVKHIDNRLYRAKQKLRQAVAE